MLDSSGKTSNRMATTVFFKDSLDTLCSTIHMLRFDQHEALAGLQAGNFLCYVPSYGNRFADSQM